MSSWRRNVTRGGHGTLSVALAPHRIELHARVGGQAVVIPLIRSDAKRLIGLLHDALKLDVALDCGHGKGAETGPGLRD